MSAPSADPRSRVLCFCVHVYRVCSVYVMWLEFFCLPLICFFNLPSFLPLSPHHILFWCCISSISFAPGLLCTVSLFLSCCPPDLFKSLQPGSQVALPPHLQLAFSGKCCKNPPPHCRSLRFRLLTLPLLPFACFNPFLCFIIAILALFQNLVN